MIAKIQIRRGTTAEWAAASPVVLAAGEPGWDATLKGMKVGDGETEWAELPWIDSKNNPTVNRQNILHNADFRNPVNQRGVSGAISTGTYFFDRWIRNSGTVTTNAAYLTIGASAVIEQRIEGNLLAGKTVTVGVMVGDAVYSGTGVMPASAGTASVTLTGWGTATLGYATGYMYLRLSPTASSNVQVVKLEIGTVSTLHLDPPMDHSGELPKCQRFFVRLKSSHLYGVYAVGVAINTSQVVYPISLPLQMRVIPSMTISGTLSVSNLSVTSMSGSILHVTQSGSFTTGSTHVLFNAGDSNAYIDLSSDL